MPIAGARFDVGPKMGNKFVTNIWFFRFDFYVLGRVIKWIKGENIGIRDFIWV